MSSALLPANLPSVAAAVKAYHAHAVDAKKYPPPTVTPGVYAFWQGDRCMYVGESNNLRLRLHGHPRKQQLRHSCIKWLACSNHKSVEEWLIAAFKPQCNGVTQEHLDLLALGAKIAAATPIDERLSNAWFAIFGHTFESEFSRE